MFVESARAAREEPRTSEMTRMDRRVVRIGKLLSTVELAKAYRSAPLESPHQEEGPAGQSLPHARRSGHRPGVPAAADAARPGDRYGRGEPAGRRFARVRLGGRGGCAGFPARLDPRDPGDGGAAVRPGRSDARLRPLRA